MATLVLGALGTLVGGPIGGAIGAIVGQRIDGEIFASGNRKGPRLKELDVTTSSYGTPIPQHHGKVRAAGTIIWSTDLVESSESSGGGKGTPKTTSYSYSSSFAVALASRPISGVGRIWADGNLLRGAAGDLKTGGSLRIYTGEGDQQVDPLIRAAVGEHCPAFRHTAYVVFEDLQLEDFGNRIPALTFEIYGETEISLKSVMPGKFPVDASSDPLGGLTGLSYEGGNLSALLETLGQLFPSRTSNTGEALTLRRAITQTPGPGLLPAPAVWDDADFGRRDGRSLERQVTIDQPLTGVRYYDVERDYQTGVQRIAATPGQGPENILQFPGSLFAPDAARLLGHASLRQKRTRETLRWRIVELAEAFLPGKVVRAPGYAGLWEVTGYEWLEKGVELELRPVPQSASIASTGDSGVAAPPADWLASETLIRAFELPWDGNGSPEVNKTFLAASSTSPAWRGASLYADGDSGLTPIGNTGRTQTVMGSLETVLPASNGLVLEHAAFLNIVTLSEEHAFASTSLTGLSNGENRLLIGNEIVQFMDAQQLSGNEWRLTRLLRGRGGTEQFALAGHSAGTPITAIGDQLVGLNVDTIPTDGAIAAIGRADPEPVISPIINRGIGSKPLTPVHPRAFWLADGSLQLCWTRRARGGWSWRDNIDQPVIEDSEIYRVGAGDPSALGSWETDRPEITLAPGDLVGLSGQSLWVRQVGSRAQSDALALMILP